MKKHELLTIVLFCGFLLSMTLGFFLLPKSEFSVNEKRFLAEAPDVTWDNISSGDWGNDIESYLADHIPGRDFFVGLNAYFELLTGRQVGKDIRAEGGKLLEAPLKANEAAIARNMKAINSFAENVQHPVDLMIIPSAGWAMGLEGYQDEQIIHSIYGQAKTVGPLNVCDQFAGKPELYYDTDHHWTSEGAYTAYRFYMKRTGRWFRTEDHFSVETVSGFQGSTYSRSALWLTEGENLELWHGSDGLTVTNAETEMRHEGVFYRERLEEADKYTVYLDGNHPIVRIQNPNAEGKLLVIRDSYSNSLGCFLAESYGEVVLIDLRYYRQPVSQLVAEETFDDILICYSIGNFMTDTNLVWLR